MQIKVPPRHQAVPTGRYDRSNRFRAYLHHSDNGNRDTGNRHNGKLNHIGPYDTQHTAQHHIDRGDGCKEYTVSMRHVFSRYIKRDILGNKIPWEEYLHKFTHADKAVAKETQHADQGVDNDNRMRQAGAFVLSEPCLYPFRPCQHIRPAEPDREIDHQEDLVKYRPEPRHPGTFDSINKG